MIKKTFKLVALTCLLSASCAFANNNTLLTNANARAMLHYPTDITIVNATTDYIYAVVPNSTDDLKIAPGFNDYLYRKYEKRSLFTVLLDPGRYQFYSALLCPLAMVVITGRPGGYRINTDTHLCD